MKHYFVEHDMPQDPFASITTILENLKKMVGKLRISNYELRILQVLLCSAYEKFALVR